MMVLLFVPFQTHAWYKPSVKKDGLILKGDLVGSNLFQINPPPNPALTKCKCFARI